VWRDLSELSELLLGLREACFERHLAVHRIADLDGLGNGLERGQLGLALAGQLARYGERPRALRRPSYATPIVSSARARAA
jgi:hypothetical protein